MPAYKLRGGSASNLGPVSAAGMHWQSDTRVKQRQPTAITGLLSRLNLHRRMLCGRELHPYLQMLAMLDVHTPVAGRNKRLHMQKSGGSARYVCMMLAHNEEFNTTPNTQRAAQLVYSSGGKTRQVHQ